MNSNSFWSLADANQGEYYQEKVDEKVTFDAQEALSTFDTWNTCTHCNLQRIFDAVYNRHISKCL